MVNISGLQNLDEVARKSFSKREKKRCEEDGGGRPANIRIDAASELVAVDGLGPNAQVQSIQSSLRDVELALFSVDIGGSY